MELFISWSGALSFGVAVTLQKWFKEVIQAVDPFVSSETDKGTKWFTEIQKKLGHSSIGIICLSRENLHSDWILFEAGALAKQMKKSRVCPLLIDLSPSEVGAPLSQFQATTLTKSDLKRLVTSVNKSLPSKAQLQESFLDAQFEKCWPDFEKTIQTAIEHSKITRGDESNTVIAGLLLPIIYREIERGELEQITDWFELVRGSKEIAGHPEVLLAQASLARFCGKRNAVPLLESLMHQHAVIATHTRLELMALKYSVLRSPEELVLDWNTAKSSDAGSNKVAQSDWYGISSGRKRSRSYSPIPNVQPKSYQ